MKTQNAKIHINLWHRDFWLLAIANFLLYTSVYMQIPMLPLWMASLGLTSVDIGCVMGIFGIGLFGLGCLCSFLVQRFRRNLVCIFATITLGVCSFLQIYAGNIDNPDSCFYALLVLRLVAGAVGGLAQMVLCSTLVIDTTISFQRTEANYIAGWFCRFALAVGPILGIWGFETMGFEKSMTICSLSSLLSACFIRLVKFPFRTPEENVKMCSLDRFFLPCGMPLFINLLLLTVALGLVLAIVATPTFYGMLLPGLVIAVISHHFVFQNADLKSEAVCGFLLIAGGLAVMIVNNVAVSIYLSPLLLGCGIGIIGTRFLLFFVKLSKHCQRGTSQSTFMLGWESGIAIGLFLGYAVTKGNTTDALILSLALVVIALAMYNFATHRWYMSHKNR